MDSILGSSYEQQISLSWREPLQTYGLIRQYEVNTYNPQRALESPCLPRVNHLGLFSSPDLLQSPEFL